MFWNLEHKIFSGVIVSSYQEKDIIPLLFLLFFFICNDA